MGSDELIDLSLLRLRDNCDLNKGAQEQGFEDTRSRAMIGDPSAVANVFHVILYTAPTMGVEVETPVEVVLAGRVGSDVEDNKQRVQRQARQSVILLPFDQSCMFSGRGYGRLCR